MEKAIWDVMCCKRMEIQAKQKESMDGFSGSIWGVITS